MLELKGISKYYNVGSVNEMCLFQDFNLNIEKGEFLSVVWTDSDRGYRYYKRKRI